MIIGLIVLCLTIWIPGIHALECYACSNVTSLCECHTIQACPSDSDACYSEYITTGTGKRYTLGCKAKQKCPISSTGGSPVIGRAVSQTCSECCHKANCNRQLCQEPDPFCLDKASFDCASVGAAIDICDDTNHAKSNCRNFCGLCALRDGGWTAWTVWSSCDVTCGNGTKSRSRKCTDPKPQECGKSCTGSVRDTTACLTDPCPVHGGWTTWSPWGSCSVTCDIGMQRRDRSCSNPYPALGGEFCFGDSRDDRLCYMAGCRDGGWSQWENWSSCSASCDVGTKTRSRTCDNPRPSLTGKSCDGDSSQTKICVDQKCQDGGWSYWGNWSSCSASCDVGTKTRSRSCDNPRPSLTGSHCDAKFIGFTSDRPTIKINKWVFEHVITNLGGGYNSTTGVFTCTDPGMYVFTTILVKKRTSPKVDYIRGYMYKNSNRISIIHIDPTDDDTDKGSYSTTGTVVTHLARGDIVYIYHYIGEVESWSSFSGFLIQPDY